MMKPRIRNIEGVTVIDVNQPIDNQRVEEYAEGLMQFSLGLLTGLYGNVGGHLVRGVPRIGDEDKVIAHGSDRYDPTIVSEYDEEARSLGFDPRRTVHALPLSDASYPYCYGPMVVAIRSSLRRLEHFSPEGSALAGLLFFREDRTTLIRQQGYGGLYQLEPQALDTILLIHPDAYGR